MPKGIKPRLGLHGAPHGDGGNAFLKKISKPRSKEFAKEPGYFVGLPPMTMGLPVVMASMM